MATAAAAKIGDASDGSGENGAESGAMETENNVYTRKRNQITKAAMKQVRFLEGSASFMQNVAHDVAESVDSVAGEGEDKYESGQDESELAILQGQLLESESDNQAVDVERPQQKRMKTKEDILSKLFMLKLSSSERRARRNYSQLSEKKPDFMTVSMDEIDFDTQGIAGWTSLTHASRGGESSLDVSPDSSPIPSRSGSPAIGMSHRCTGLFPQLFYSLF